MVKIFPGHRHFYKLVVRNTQTMDALYTYKTFPRDSKGKASYFQSRLSHASIASDPQWIWNNMDCPLIKC